MRGSSTIPAVSTGRKTLRYRNTRLDSPKPRPPRRGFSSKPHPSGWGFFQQHGKGWPEHSQANRRVFVHQTSRDGEGAVIGPWVHVRPFALLQAYQTAHIPPGSGVVPTAFSRARLVNAPYGWIEFKSSREVAGELPVGEANRSTLYLSQTISIANRHSNFTPCEIAASLKSKCGECRSAWSGRSGSRKPRKAKQARAWCP